MTKRTETSKTPPRFTEGVGRRKTASARVRVHPGRSGVEVNGKNASQYFSLPRFCDTAQAPLARLDLVDSIGVTVRVSGGGLHAQAEAIAHGLARALAKLEPAYKSKLRAFGFLTRDPRMVERKKPGLKKARRAPQWQKR